MSSDERDDSPLGDMFKGRKPLDFTGEAGNNMEQFKDDSRIVFQKDKLTKMLAEMMAELKEYADDPTLSLKERSERDRKRVEIRKKYPALEPLLRMRERQIAQGRVPQTKPAVGRNSPCPCGSEKKYKKCCMIKGLN